jgi:cytochrome P450
VTTGHQEARGLGDPADPALYGAGNPEELWRELRSEAPVQSLTRPDGRTYWSVTRYEDVSRILKSADAFSSERGMRVDAPQAATAYAAGRQLVVTDPPRHGQVRATINTAFTKRMLERLRERVRGIVNTLIDEALAQPGVDFVDLVAPLPAAITSELLGVPDSDWPELLRLTRIAFASNAHEGGEYLRADAHAAIFDYYSELTEARRAAPKDDVVSMLVGAEIDGRPLTDDEILLNCDGLVSGGHETTRHAASRAVLAMIQQPSAYQAARNAPSVGSVVEEVLRWTSPALHVLRTPLHDLRLHDVDIKAGQPIALWLASANRDESVFTEPDEFVGTRSPNRHLTFSTGRHFCIGAAVARLELEILFEVMFERVDAITLAGEPERLHSNLLWGLLTLPVAFSGRG